MRAFTLIALLAVAGFGCVAAWLLYTPSGFAWSIAQLERAAGPALVLENAHGTLSGGMTARQVRYSLDDGTTVVAVDVALRLSPASLAARAPRVLELRCAELTITLAPATKPSTLPTSLALPIEINVLGARIDRLLVVDTKAAIEVRKIEFDYSGDAAAHRLRNASFDLYGTRVAGEGIVAAASPFPIDASITAGRETAPAGKLEIHAKGPLQALGVKAQADSVGGRATLGATLTPYGPLLVEKLRATVSELDLRAFVPALPQTAFDGALTLESGRARDELKGRIELKNRLVGVYDRERLPLSVLDATVETNLARARMTGRADLGIAGRFTGNGEIGPDGVTLELRTDGFNLAGIHGRLRPTRLSGRIDARLGGQKQAITADLAERGLQLALRGERTGDTVELHDMRARARGGEARGTGRIDLSGAQAFSAEARLTAFNPAAWGNFPAGAVNGRATAKGSLKPRYTLDASFAIETSQLRGVPLAGNGRATLLSERVTAAQADLDWGGNRITARGAWGGSGDVLTIGIEMPRLGVANPDWAGRANGTVQLSGNWQLPDVKFEVSGNSLALAQGTRLDTLSARGEYSSRPDAPLKLNATMNGLVVPGLRVDRGSADIDGTRQAHTATLRAQGGTLDLLARASGGWQPQGSWSGTLQELENRGPYPVVLETPVAIETGPHRLHLGKLAARIAGGRFDVGEFRYEGGRIASQGRFSELRADVILALAGYSPDAGGSVRLGGDWNLTSVPRWNGAISIRRESGDLSLTADKATALGLEALTLDAVVADDRVDFRGALRARVANGRVEGSISPVADPEGPRITAGSPMKFTSSLEIARLGALSALQDSALQFDGRLRAAIAGSGTLGDPQLSGTIEGDEISIALASEGVNLRNGTLRAALAGREVQIQSFSIRGGNGTFRAQGTLARSEAGRAALDWEAERVAIMARPGRRALVTGRGKATLENGKVTLSGELRADEGEIELRTGALPAPGDDVVIVGRQRSAAEAPQLRQTALDLTLDFGDRFRIAGRGLDTFLAGRIRVQTGAAGELVAKGDVRAVRGTYTAFGQRLELERGRLIFEGPIDNPTLDIRAMRRMPEVEAGVEVAGTLRRPFVRVVSQPSLPQNEALSWLILGHAPDDASGTDLSMLPVAAAALLGQDENVGTGGVARTFGLDSIGLRGGGTTGNQAITFGKRVADNIYVVYEQGFSATANLLKLEFNLTRRVLLRAESGQTSSIGMFYRWAFD